MEGEMKTMMMKMMSMGRNSEKTSMKMTKMRHNREIQGHKGIRKMPLKRVVKAISNSTSRHKSRTRLQRLVKSKEDQQDSEVL